MKFKLHDTTAYGIYNGVSSSDIQELCSRLAGEYGLDILDYNRDEIERSLRNDAELESLAERTYQPLPILDWWGDDYKEMMRQLALEHKAPGYGEIPDEAVEQKIRLIFAKIADDVVKPRRERQRKADEERSRILSRVTSVVTEEREIEDEGGQTMMYIHTVLMPSGNKYVFKDRNVFDVGRVINYRGMLLSRHNGKVFWSTLSDHGGWTEEETTEDDEAVIAYRAAEQFGFCDSQIRM